MVQRVISFLIKPNHPDYGIAREQVSQSRRLFNGLNSIARIVHARNKLKLTTAEEQPVDERLLTVFGAHDWADNKPYLGNRTTFESLRKRVELTQGIVLPQKVAQHVGRELSEAWASFYALRRQGLYSSPPSYRQKYGTVRYTNQAVSTKRQGWVKPTGWSTGIQTPPQVTNVQAARLTHSHGSVFKLEIIYLAPEPLIATGDTTASIDFGLNNLITLVTDDGSRPKIVTGKELKSVNQFYNKRSAKLQQALKRGGETKSNKVTTLWARRTRKVNHILHSVSSQVISYLVSTGTGTLVIGWNNGFKDKINIGRKNNQQFVNIPHARLRDMLTYKAELAGLNVIIQEESYTSKASFIDNDPIPVYPTAGKPVFSGKRVSRGNYKSKNGIMIHADVNGAWNIMRKSNPTTSWSNGIIVTPERLVVKH
jgi:putative transposase